MMISYIYIYIFATTNRWESIDVALLRKEKLYLVLYVLSPSHEDQVALVKYYVNKYSLSQIVTDQIVIDIHNHNDNNNDNRK